MPGRQTLSSIVQRREIQGTYNFEELLRYSVEKHLLGQSAADVIGRKRRRDSDIDSEYIAPAAKRTKGDSDRKCPAPATRRIESDSDRECPAPPAKRKRADRYNVVYKKELALIMIYNTDSDLYIDMIIYISTIDKQQLYYLMKNYIGSSIALDPDFLGYIDPAPLAL
ncbi:hypothetical protein C8A01DRAFT_51612 [Parachaetomium inaequale]|uniref:Uncharacterized protein n=1 Tax=Parachaetomium inaequale TaxID=2588326 RepID=A0AAN6P5P2_9PEZI|nr:hypothetical protein C8A01DRAFT_51612 [Parachaetomium inaequale]